MTDTAPAEIEPRKGQIWREVDPRQNRYVRVLGVNGMGEVQVETVYNADGKWFRAHGTRRGWAKLDRFNGRRGGYALQEDAK
jgi:hypothetical protein